MKEMSYIEKAFVNVNAAYSINYTVLQNIEFLKRSINEPEMPSSFLNPLNPFDKDYFNEIFDRFTVIRNKYFAEIRRFLSVENFSAQFQSNVEYLLIEYNKVFNKNVKPSDFVSDKDIRDWDKFNEICNDVNSLGENSGIENINLMLTLSHFLQFYEDHKQWIEALEIFDSLETDITTYGNKALDYGKPAHPNVLNIKSSEISTFLASIKEFVTKKTTEVQKKYKRKKQLDFEELEQLDAENYALKSLAQLIDRIQERIRVSNTNTMALGSFFTRLKFKLLPYSTSEFKIDDLYVHKYEILDLVSTLSFFPELETLSDEISAKFLDEKTEIAPEKNI